MRPFFISISLTFHNLINMAANIFTEKDFDYITKRIQGLSETNNRRWGTMNLAQMLAHCSLQLELALGKSAQEGVEGPGVMRTRIGRYLSLYVFPWMRGLPTPAKMNTAKNKLSNLNLEEQRLRLLELLDELKDTKNSLNPHPFFGPLNRQDWGRLIWKHLDYHLRQFSA